MSGETAALASFASGLELAELPGEVVHEAQRALIDWLAAAFAGSDAPGAHALHRAGLRLSPGTAAGLVGRQERASRLFAALINGFASHVEDYDDTFNPGDTTVHGSAPVWPVVFALADAGGVSGARALAAFVAGFEVETRVGRAAGPGHYEAGWHVTGTVGHFGAAAAAAHLLGLPAALTTLALGTAGTQAAGVKEVYGTDGKALHPGKAAMDGLLSAMAAQEGFTSATTLLEGQRGFLAVLAPAPEPERLTEGLGVSWNLLANGYKAYPSGSLTHPTIDALLALRARYGFTVDDVDSVEARVHPWAASTTGKVRPGSGLEAKFSLTHGAGAALVAPRLTLAHFTDAGVAAPPVVAARELVTVVPDESLTKRGAVVTAVLRDGRTLREVVTANKGTPDNPLPDADLEAKLLDAAAARIGPSKARELLATCWKSAELADFGELVRSTAA